MLRHPPSSTLFPTRRSSDLERLEPVLRWRTEIARLKDLPAGHGIGYGTTFHTLRPSRIATLPVGYADGYDRSEEHTSELQSRRDLVCRLLLEKKNKNQYETY